MVAWRTAGWLRRTHVFAPLAAIRTPDTLLCMPSALPLTVLASTVSGRALGIHNRVSGVRIAASGAKTWVRRNQPAVLQATTWVIRGVT